jgi:hypothetical protein
MTPLENTYAGRLAATGRGPPAIRIHRCWPTDMRDGQNVQRVCSRLAGPDTSLRRCAEDRQASAQTDDMGRIAERSRHGPRSRLGLLVRTELGVSGYRGLVSQLTGISLHRYRRSLS